MRNIKHDYTSCLNEHLKLALHVYRLKQMACELFKIINKLSPQYINDLVEIKKNPIISGQRQAEILRSHVCGETSCVL